MSPEERSVIDATRGPAPTQVAIEVTRLYCPLSGVKPGEDGSTHHLQPRTIRGDRVLLCRHCQRTEKALRDVAAGAVRQPEHVDYPHEPGRLYDCPACDARCHCVPHQAECVFEGEHNGLASE